MILEKKEKQKNKNISLVPRAWYFMCNYELVFYERLDEE